LKLLLDTHIWLWSLVEPERLSRRVTKALENASSEMWISPVSTWEILTLCQKQRLTLRPDAAHWISAGLAKSLFKEATLTTEVLLATQHVSLPHRDPADLFLAASARVYGLTLVTADEQLLKGTGYQVLAGR